MSSSSWFVNVFFILASCLKERSLWGIILSLFASSSPFPLPWSGQQHPIFVHIHLFWRRSIYRHHQSLFLMLSSISDFIFSCHCLSSLIRSPSLGTPRETNVGERGERSPTSHRKPHTQIQMMLQKLKLPKIWVGWGERRVSKRDAEHHKDLERRSYFFKVLWRRQTEENKTENTHRTHSFCVTFISRVIIREPQQLHNKLGEQDTLQRSNWSFALNFLFKNENLVRREGERELRDQKRRLK